MNPPVCERMYIDATDRTKDYYGKEKAEGWRQQVSV